MTIAKIPKNIPELIEYLELHNFGATIDEFKMATSSNSFGFPAITTIDLTLTCYDKDEDLNDKDEGISDGS